MSRIRYIKPQFFDNYELSQLDPYARLLFISIWCQADREGRLKDEPERIRARALPYNKVNINKLLDLLSKGDDSWIVRYEVEGTRYIQVRHWKKHQHPHVKEPASTIPAPYSHHAKPEQAPDKSSSGPLGNGEWGMGNGQRVTECDGLFAEVFNAYPEHRRDDSYLTQTAWAAIMGPLHPEDRPGLHAKILDGLERAKVSEDWTRGDGQYVPNLRKFLEERQWTRTWRGPAKSAFQILAEKSAALIRQQEAEEAAGR